MSSLRQRLLRRLHSRALRSILVLGLLPKLLIPIGFMPAALADGGPITICGASGFMPAAAGSDAPPQPVMHGAHAGHGPSADLAGPGDHTGMASGIAGAAAAGADPVTDAASGAGDEHEHHDQWERCAFAGTASATPLGIDWQLALVPQANELVGISPAILTTRAPTVYFRSRAPPTLHS